MYYASKFATNTQEIEQKELEPWCIGIYSAVDATNRGPSSTALLISVIFESELPYPISVRNASHAE